jgi:putative selenate reductase
VTSCTDLLRPGGFERLHRQGEALANALRSASSSTVPEFLLARAGGADRGRAPGSLATAALTNHRRAAADALSSPHYRAERTSKPPKKIGEQLHLMDCINCDKCVPVCPNDANFVYDTPPKTVTYRDLVVKAGRLVPGAPQTFSLGGKKVSSHQIGNYADACNDCGNCDVFCPEDGGPYIEKPRLFGSLASLLADAPRPGFFAWRDADGSLAIRGRWSGRTVELHAASDGRTSFWDGVAELTFASGEEIEPLEARVLALPPPEGHVVPIGLYHALLALLSGLFSPDAISWVNAPYLSKESTP